MPGMSVVQPGRLATRIPGSTNARKDPLAVANTTRASVRRKAATGRTPESGDHSPHPPHILLVEDDADIMEVLTTLFVEEGFRVSTCSNPADALARLAGEPVHLIITDRRLNGGDGLDLIRHLHAHRRRDVRAMLLTAARPPVPDSDAHLLREAGVAVMAKPFDIEALLEQVRALTNWRP
jgi:CheY-like chemotaxis protein